MRRGGHRTRRGAARSPFAAGDVWGKLILNILIRRVVWLRAYRPRGCMASCLLAGPAEKRLYIAIGYHPPYDDAIAAARGIAVRFATDRLTAGTFPPGHRGQTSRAWTADESRRWRHGLRRSFAATRRLLPGIGAVQKNKGPHPVRGLARLAGTKICDCSTRHVRERWKDFHSAAMRFGRPHGAIVARRKGGNFARTRGDLCSAGHDCRKLVVPARKAESGPALGARPRGDLRALAGGRQPTGRAPPRQSGAMPGTLKPTERRTYRSVHAFLSAVGQGLL
jgi:hypothetical protein